MMNKKYANFVWLIIFPIASIIFIGCSKAITPIPRVYLDFPDVGVPLDNLNKYMKITLPDAIHLSKQEKCFFVIAENISDNTITVEPDADIKIFQKEISEWVPVQNGLSYSKSIWDIPVNGGDIPNIIPVDMCPMLYDFNQPAVLRIVIIGEVKEIFGSKRIISYLDFGVNP